MHDSKYMTFWKRQIYRDSKNISGCEKFGVEKDEQAESTEEFQSSENTLCDTVTAGTCHCVFVQAHRMYTTKSEP